MPRSPSEKVQVLSLFATFDEGSSDGYITRCSHRACGGGRRSSAYVDEVRDLARLSLRWR